jgi:anti-sigma regulatory factor (Ser/Thr protein kinase)
VPRLLDVRLPVSVRAPGIARREIRRLASGLEEQQRDDLTLLVSELVSNSVRHARHSTDSIQLKAWRVDPAIRVSVVDSGPGFAPAVVVPEPHEEGRRGLWLLDMLADTWGISVDGTTSSWFEMHGPAPDGAPADQPLEPFLDAIAGWPLRSRELAWSMAASLGPADIVGRGRLSWTTAEWVATILCPDCPGQPDDNEPRHHGMVEERNSRWWLETLRNNQHQSAGGSSPRLHPCRRPPGRRGAPATSPPLGAEGD